MAVVTIVKLTRSSWYGKVIVHRYLSLKHVYKITYVLSIASTFTPESFDLYITYAKMDFVHFAIAYKHSLLGVTPIQKGNSCSSESLKRTSLYRGTKILLCGRSLNLFFTT